MTDSAPIPIVAFVGRKGTGKTTLLEGLVAALTGRGMRVAAAKHHPATDEHDVPNTDSWRLARAGSVATILDGPEGVALYLSGAAEIGLEGMAQIAQATAGAEILLAEGYKRVAPVRIEVVREAVSRMPVCAPHELVALATDAGEVPEGYQGLPVFRLVDLEALADFVCAIDVLEGGETDAD
jgi:molybdopterin-guanine dinucleotide biosynthesis protein MobB